ncbi:serine hydrolase [Aquibaculum arenosum]|uniref:beta-lactamase n=1 Tax=Aquibaculum arenosum TaxID=3032591 RepID=A0ABT5YQ41_9PROT|nr:serine hydrolase [Fodinicurvata sp. CAU 1616]MDF2097081.1 class A beta-lactamase-related serine hydrolase [Fodinicurvata sp. CAU 1616]
MHEQDESKALAELLARTPKVDWSIKVVDVTGGAVIASAAPEQNLKTASLAKVFLLLEVAARLEAGSLHADEPLDRRRVPRVADSGLWQHLRSDRLPLADAALLVATVSDNWATNALLQRVTLAAVQARGRALGYPESRLEDCVRDDRRPDDPPTISLGRAADWADLFARLHRRQLVSPAVDSQVAQWLACNVDLSLLAAAFHLDPLAHEVGAAHLRLYNKTGSDSGVRADAGLITGQRTLAYCAIANWHPEEDCLDGVMETMRGVGEIVRKCVGAWALE